MADCENPFLPFVKTEFMLPPLDILFFQLSFPFLSSKLEFILFRQLGKVNFLPL